VGRQRYSIAERHVDGVGQFGSVGQFDGLGHVDRMGEFNSVGRFDRVGELDGLGKLDSLGLESQREWREVALAEMPAPTRMLTHGGSVSKRSRDRQEAGRRSKLRYEMTRTAYQVAI
jgi:hypothetical protein